MGAGETDALDAGNFGDAAQKLRETAVTQHALPQKCDFPDAGFGKRADFGDFKLKLQYRWWRMTERPNSGVFVRLAAETGTFIPRCYENQLDPKGACSIFALDGCVLEGVAPRTPYDVHDIRYA
jgi:hypothetical protein